MKATLGVNDSNVAANKIDAVKKAKPFWNPKKIRSRWYLFLHFILKSLKIDENTITLKNQQGGNVL